MSDEPTKLDAGTVAMLAHMLTAICDGRCPQCCEALPLPRVWQPLACAGCGLTLSREQLNEAEAAVRAATADAIRQLKGRRYAP